MSKERFMLWWRVDCFYFIFSGNAICVTGWYHALRFGDRFFTSGCCTWRPRLQLAFMENSQSV